MATVIWGGSVAVQPAQGEMRRFIVRSRVDGGVLGKEVVPADTNKIMLIKAGWIVKGFWGRLIKHGTMGDVALMVKNAAGGNWLGTAGIEWAVGGSANNDTTRGTQGNMTAGNPSAIKGPSFALAGLGCSAADAMAYRCGIPFIADDYLYWDTGNTGACFDGIADFFADVVDTNPYASPAAFSD